MTAESLYHQALALWAQGQREQAVGALQAACDLAPQPLYLANLAAALVELQRWGESEAAIRRCLELDALRAESWYGLGNALTGQQRWHEAAQAYARALELKPELPRGDAVAAQAWSRAGDPQRAAQHYLRSISGELGRDDPEILTATAQALRQLGHVDQPLELYRRVAALLPSNAAAQSNLGIIYQSLARYDEAIACYRQALALAPSLQGCWSNLIVCLNYSPGHTPRDVLEASSGFERACAAGLAGTEPHRNSRDPARRLRVGYVSPDLHRHAVAYFLLPLLENHSSEVEVYCYNNSDLQDEWTQRLRAASAGWLDCAALSDEELAARIRSDGIDILIDLAGHTEHNRLMVFARKPAPVQVTWMGYVLTTGLRTIDWRLTYPLADPPGAEADYAERLWRLPLPMWGWRPLPGMPEVASAPFDRKGFVTFGHFNRYAKVSQPALECWARVLAQVPGSRLVMGLPPGATRLEVGRFFESRGVAATRIDAYDKIPHAKFWELHAEVDIALDPFPFAGGTTSYETLWLGVPVVSCSGEAGGFAPRFSSRMGKALLHGLDLQELVTDDPQAYVTTAVALARDPARLRELRASLRARMGASALLDERLHAAAFESALRGMWRQWCAALS